jgi:hypothetical protein
VTLKNEVATKANHEYCDREASNQAGVSPENVMMNNLRFQRNPVLSLPLGLSENALRCAWNDVVVAAQILGRWLRSR